jgi:hypothetical protein
MRAYSAAELLTTWERGQGGSGDVQALALLATSLPAASPGALARLSIGRRDAALLTMRERVFGARLTGRAPCPACGEGLELDFTADQIRAPEAGGGDDAGDVAPPSGDEAVELELTHDGYSVRFRLPNTLDARAAACAPDLAAARAALIERCVIEAQHRDVAVVASALPEAVCSALAGRMAELDPQADVRLALTCPACGHAWSAPFDIGAYFWEELHAWAMRILREVHILAHAYGWSEADILALSPARRRAYLEMVEG